jgi:hypothetical protein
MGDPWPDPDDPEWIFPPADAPDPDDPGWIFPPADAPPPPPGEVHGQGDLVGEPIDWSAGLPDQSRLWQLARSEGLRSLTLEQVRERRKRAEDRALEQATTHLRSAGLSEAQARRCLRLPRLRVCDPATLLDRIETLQAHLPAESIPRVVSGAPTLLLHTNLHATLPRKLEQLEATIGLKGERILFKAPGLLAFDASAIEQRVCRLQSCLPGIEVRPVLRVAPRLLGCDPSKLATTFELLAQILPATVNVTRTVQLQPTLLASSPKLLEPKLELLRELCSEEEWDAVVQSTSFARLLTASLSVIERLRTLPPNKSGKPRPVVSSLLLPKAKYEALYGATDDQV